MKIIRSEISNISDVVLENTATAQQTAAATESLSKQSENLEKLVKGFKVANSDLDND